MVLGMKRSLEKSKDFGMMEAFQYKKWPCMMMAVIGTLIAYQNILDFLASKYFDNQQLIS